jgi:hypothetical protein
VKSVRILPDEKSVFLEIPNLLPALQTHIFAELETEEGPLEMNAFATLVHLDKAKKGFAEPMPALKSRRLHCGSGEAKPIRKEWH